MSACTIHLEEGRYTWRRDSVLKIIADPGDFLTSVTNNIDLYSGATGYMTPIITGNQRRPDIVVIDKRRTELELTVGFESNNALHKRNHL